MPWLVLLIFIAAMAFAVENIRPSGRALAQSAAPEVTVTIDKTRVTVGDPISLTVLVRHAPDVRIGTTSLDDQLGNLEPLSSDPPDERSLGGNLELRLRYKVAIYHTGPAPIPQFVFQYTLPDGTTGQATAAAQQEITVESIISADANPTDIKGLKSQFSLPIPPGAGWTLAAGLGALAVALLLAVGALALLWRRRGAIVAPPHPAPAVAARAELDRIMGMDLAGQADLVGHYRLLSACIRRFVSERYGFPAVALTTGELEQRMDALGVDRWPARLVCGLLNECDAVTYARYVPAEPRLEADNAMAYEIIETMDSSSARLPVPVR